MYDYLSTWLHASAFTEKYCCYRAIVENRRGREHTNQLVKYGKGKIMCVIATPEFFGLW